MSRQSGLHEEFSDWLGGRRIGANDDPPRDLALHAAGCDRCLRAANAIDSLAAIDVGAAPALPFGRPAAHRDPGGIPAVARYAIAGTALVVLVGTAAFGSSLFGAPNRGEERVAAETFDEGVLGGVPESSDPTPTTSPSPTPTPSDRPSGEPSASADPSDDDVAESAAPRPADPQPTTRPLPTVTPTRAPTAAPSATPAPSDSATPTPLVPVPTPTPIATPLPTLDPTLIPSPSESAGVP